MYGRRDTFCQSVPDIPPNHAYPALSRKTERDHGPGSGLVLLRYVTLLPSYPSQGHQIMDKDRIKGTVKQAQGKVMEGVGTATDDPNLQTKGKVKQAEGTIQKAFGKSKDAVRKD